MNIKRNLKWKFSSENELLFANKTPQIKAYKNYKNELTNQLHGAEFSWEAARRSDPQEISKIVWNQKVQYRVHNRHPLAPILKDMNPVHSTMSYFSKTQFNIILPSTSRSS
jgi:hypothetical protein